MSGAEEKNDKRAGKDENLPTASFSGSVKGPVGQMGSFRIERELGRGAVVVHRASGSIRPFDFLNMNDYCTGVSAKVDNKE